jgi:hypothetical protein
MKVIVDAEFHINSWDSCRGQANTIMDIQNYHQRATGPTELWILYKLKIFQTDKIMKSKIFDQLANYWANKTMDHHIASITEICGRIRSDGIT